ncbi:MAG: ABC transporter ATP-binding protein [Chloroflexi bacterium]|nr:ABC transporter ATP-binding protein [Chloroflexota bacterium]MCY3915596.1 ABC transporter ATP-binding protein [Chloroflexota bacterium]
MRKAVIQAKQVTRNLKLGTHIVQALRGVDLTIYANEMVGIIGPSGSGKSTLLGIVGGLDSPTDGTIEIDGIDITRMSEGQLTDIRNQKIGFVFQFFNLIPTLTALENVALPIEFAQARRHNPFNRARELLDMLGLGARLHHRPSELSGGQQQRVAIARALANDPPILLADEPTGNLDTHSGETVLQALKTIRDESGTTVVMVTHDQSLAAQMDRVLTLVDGRVVNGIAGDLPSADAHQTAAARA